MSENRKHNLSIVEDAPLFAGLEDSPWHRKAAVKPEQAPLEELNTKPRKAQGKPAAAKAKKHTVSTPAANPAASTKNVVARKRHPQNAEPATSGKRSGGKSELLLSVADMCKLLGVSRATLVRMDSGNKIPGRMKLGGSVRYHRAVVENWLLELAGASE